MPFIPTFTQTVIPSNIRAFAPLVKHNNTTNTTLFIDNTFRLGILNTGVSPSISYDNTNKYFDLFTGNTTTYLLSAMTNLRPTPTPTPTPSRPPVLPYNLDLTGDMYNINLRQIYQQRSGDTSNTPVNAYFRALPGARIGGSASGYAVTVGQWPAGSTVYLTVYPGAYVLGKGGDGGYTYECCSYSANQAKPTAGGPCLNVDCDSGIFYIINNGIIGGGGGGGGAWWNSMIGIGCFFYITAGGGGGAGFPFGIATQSVCCASNSHYKSCSSYQRYTPTAECGVNGGLTVGGNGGRRNYNNGAPLYYGGQGGYLGNSGGGGGGHEQLCTPGGGWSAASAGAGGGLLANGWSKVAGLFYDPSLGPPGLLYGSTQG